MNNKSLKIIFWTTTTLIFLFEGVMPAFTFQSELAKEGMRHLGYPEYLSALLLIFKAPGTLVLMLPMVPPKLKEWAYAGFGIDFIGACLSFLFVDGFKLNSFAPLVAMFFLVASYICYHRLKNASK